MPTTWKWNSRAIPSGYWSNQSMSAAGHFLCPVGSSIQRVVISGGFTNFATVQTQTGGRQQSQSTVFGDLFIEEWRNNAVYDYYLERHIEWQRQGSWGSGSPTDTNEAASFSWSTPWDAMEWDADVRMRGTSTNGVGVRFNSQTFGQTIDGILGPINQAAGVIFLRVLTSSTT